MRVEHRPDADQNIRAEARRFAAELALETDRTPQQCGEADLEHQLEAEDLHDLFKHS